MVVAVLFNTGDHVPVIPLVDVVGNADKASSEQIGVTGLNVGVTEGSTTIWAESLMVQVVVVVNERSSRAKSLPLTCTFSSYKQMRAVVFAPDAHV